MTSLRFYAVPAFSLIFVCVAIQGAQTKNNSPDKPVSSADAKSSSEIYVAGGDVKPPKVVHYVEPEFSPSAQEAFVEGVVRIAAVVNLDGGASDLHITKGLNAGADKLALEALRQWRFKPGIRNGKPVRVRINVEINFHLL